MKVEEYIVKMAEAEFQNRARFSNTQPKSAVQEDPVKPKHYPQPDPYAYALAHGLNLLEGNVVKYVTRWRKKGGVQDLRKAIETLNRLIDSTESWTEKKWNDLKH